MHAATKAGSDDSDDFRDFDREELRHWYNHNGVPATPSMITMVPLNQRQLIIINVSGMRFEVFADTLGRFPDSLLGNSAKRAPFYNPETQEFFFERHRPSFDAILYYYQSGGFLKRPPSIPPPIFERECRFFEIGPKHPGDHKGSQNMPEPVVMPKAKWRRKLFLILEYPDSSKFARAIGIFSFCVIMVSTVSFCLETIPELQAYFKCTVISPASLNAKGGNGTATSPQVEKIPCSSWTDPFFATESLCIVWFTLEFVLRFAISPTKLGFSKSFLNWVDFIAIAPFYINLILSPWSQRTATAKCPTCYSDGGSAASFAILRVLRLVRVFRVFKLSRHSKGLQVLGKTLKASIQELMLLIFFLLMALVISGSAIYFAESGYNPQFHSIPDAFWFSIITLTTVGYGDITPVTAFGKLVGGMCAIVGVLVLALPVTVIVSNFKRFYEQEITMQAMKQDHAAHMELDGEASLMAPTPKTPLHHENSLNNRH